MTQKSLPLILIRPKAQSLELLQTLHSLLGYEPYAVVSPLMEIQTTDVTLPIVMKLPFIFTSQNGANIGAEKTRQRGSAICVGERVAIVARNHGFDVTSVYETGADLLRNGLPSQGTYLRAEQVSVAINKNSDLDEFELYRQAPLPMTAQALRAIQNGAIVPIYSEYAAKRMLDCTGKMMSNVRALCISEKVAKCLMQYDVGQIQVANAPTSDEMIKLMLKLLKCA